VKRVFVTGGAGQFGNALVPLLGAAEVICPTIDDLDISQESAVDFVIGRKPDLVLHAAAMTNVDDCETRPDLAYQHNALGTRNMALAARQLGAPLVYISTDYVFSGEKGAPYVELDPPDPINEYGKSKYEGEKFVRSLLDSYFIVRPCWLYGNGQMNFVFRILKQIFEGKSLTMTANVGSPTYTLDFAAALIRLIETRAYGTYHLAHDGACSRYEMTRKVCEVIGQPDYPVELAPYQQTATRPKNTSLANTAASEKLGIRLRQWDKALEACLTAGKLVELAKVATDG
jgi:dTDP-4-dehydrorhamnose reductase